DTLFKQSGFTLAVGGGAIGALAGSVQTERNLFDTASHAHDGRVNTMVAANAAIAGYQGYGAAKGLAQQFGNGVSGAGLSVSLTYGQSKATSHSVTHATQAVGSTVVGRNVTIIANGANGTKGDVTVTGSSVDAAQNLGLVAVHNLTIDAAQNTFDNATNNSSESGSVGVAASFGQGGVAFGVTVSAAFGHGNANTSSVQQVNSQVSAGDKLTFVSGEDTTLAGAVLSGSQVQGLVGGDLTIQSLQDTLQSHSAQTNVSASATFGYGASVSASYSHASSHANDANVAQQSGIEAGEGGFQINVGGNTNLIGGLLTSSQAAIDAHRNRLITGTLTTSDVQNVSDGSASTMGLGASLNTGAAFSQALHDDPNNKNHADPGNNNYLAANGGKYGLGRAIVQNLMNGRSASSSSSGETLSAISAGNIHVRNTQSGTAQTIATLEASARTNTNTQAAAPDVAALQKSAADEQTGNQLLFNAGAWVLDQPAVRYRTLSPRHVISGTVTSKEKTGNAEPMTAGSYGIAPGTTLMPFANGIDNSLSAASGNADDLATLYSSPESAANMLVVNLYSDGSSLFANALGGAWNAINANWFHGALGSPAGAQALANIARQVSKANASGAGINLMPACHSDGCAQTSIAVQNARSAFDNMNGGALAYMLFAEPSANVATVQSALNQNKRNNAAVDYSCNPNDPVCASRALGNNPSTEKASQGCFTMLSAYECSGGIGISWRGLAGRSVHSDIGYSVIVTPSASLSGQLAFSWGNSGNPLLPGNAPVFSFAPGVPVGTPRLPQDLNYGGSRTFAPLLPTRTLGIATIYFPMFSVAGSTGDHVNYALLVWPDGNAANLGTALSSMNGLPTGQATQVNGTVFAPSGSDPTLLSSPAGGSSPTGQTQPQTPETLAQKRCMVLTNNSTQCLQ
ncbi:MAG TPA: hemagglutinin repeat-containing protein, partial [Rhodanobacteraceae bacterium]